MTIEIFRKQIIKNKDVYDVCIDMTFYIVNGRRKNSHKTYKINKNGENILFTSLHQTFRKELRKENIAFM